MTELFHKLQDERWARTVGFVSGVILAVLQIVADADTWQVAVTGLIPMLAGLGTERNVYSKKTVRGLRE